MDDLISRQAAIEYYKRISEATNTDGRYNLGFVDGLEFCINHLSTMPSAQPTADVVERKKGKWLRITQGAIPEQYICPFCHRTVESYGVEELLSIRYPYCHCGADMREEKPNE